MFWKLIALALILFAAAMYFGVTLGGLVYLLPVGAGATVLVRRMGKNPNTEFGRWRAPSERRGGRR